MVCLILGVSCLCFGAILYRTEIGGYYIHIISVGMKLFLLAPILAIGGLIHVQASKKNIGGKGFAYSTFALFFFFIMFHLMTSGKPYYLPRFECSGHLKAIGQTIYDNMDVFDDKWPTAETWCDFLHEKGGIPTENFKCPKDDVGPCSYIMNKNLPLSVNDTPENMVVLFEGRPGWNQVGGSEQLVKDRHGRKGCVVLFASGSVQFVAEDRLPELQWKLDNPK